MSVLSFFVRVRGALFKFISYHRFVSFEADEGVLQAMFWLWHVLLLESTAYAQLNLTYVVHSDVAIIIVIDVI